MSDELGFAITPTIMFPLPYRKAGNFFSRTVNGITCHYVSEKEIPYTKNDRLWLEYLVTQAKVTGERRIEIGRVSDELRKMGQDRNGRYITAARKSLERLYHANVSIEKVKDRGNYKQFQGVRFSIGRKMEIAWLSGRSDKENQLWLPGINYIELSKDFMDIVNKHAVPHVRDHYLRIKSARTQDLYKWLILKLWRLESEQLIRWEHIYEQFGSDTMNYKQTEKIREHIRNGLFEIRSKYYPEAQISSTKEGIILKPSPPLISPDDKNAGFLV